MNRFDDLGPNPCAKAAMHRATVCLWAESMEEKVEFTTWLNRWRRNLPYLSHDYGCGCCIHLFDIEAPKAAIDELPGELLTISAWTENGIKQPSPQSAGEQG
jgi:hypothetical protein